MEATLKWTHDMEVALKWKYDKEMESLNVKLDCLAKAQRTVRKSIGDAIIFPPQRRGMPGPNREKICQDAFDANEEYQRLLREEAVLRQKVEAWKTLLKVPIHSIPLELLNQINSEYEHHKSEMTVNAIRTIFSYDSSTKKWKLNE